MTDLPICLRIGTLYTHSLLQLCHFTEATSNLPAADTMTTADSILPRRHGPDYAQAVPISHFLGLGHVPNPLPVRGPFPAGPVPSLFLKAI